MIPELVNQVPEQLDLLVPGSGFMGVLVIALFSTIVLDFLCTFLFVVALYLAKLLVQGGSVQSI